MLFCARNKRLKEIIVSVRGAENMLHATALLVVSSQQAHDTKMTD